MEASGSTLAEHWESPGLEPQNSPGANCNWRSYYVWYSPYMVVFIIKSELRFALIHVIALMKSNREELFKAIICSWSVLEETNHMALFSFKTMNELLPKILNLNNIFLLSMSVSSTFMNLINLNQKLSEKNCSLLNTNWTIQCRSYLYLCIYVVWIIVYNVGMTKYIGPHAHLYTSTWPLIEMYTDLDIHGDSGAPQMSRGDILYNLASVVPFLKELYYLIFFIKIIFSNIIIKLKITKWKFYVRNV